ncbi:MAG: L,D-transpeptidase family protein [Gammaproteobacteria bacterium]|nr:L,D-transpeptidase family protein [Gammaproteobacteria bacterium]MDH3364255.1 L,D-transpeptidase family protein [Gammaproteobacteria bacterium]MDH3481398.1 L,D-transpeptidase family protein [Gammaproteobacteria bacterium]
MHRLVSIVAACLLAASPSRSEVYELPPEGFDVIGAAATVTARYEDTLVDIARHHGLGYQDIVRANPDVEVWLPGEGTEVILPTRFVLPPGPREGLVLNLAEYRMYYFPKPRDGEPAYVYTYPMSIGRMDWETPLGQTKIVAMATNPPWYPPQSVRDEHAADGDPLPRVVPAGPQNPLGTRALRLGLPGYLIHGTNRPAGVGMRVSHGCIRMFPEDIEFLFQHVTVNTSVRIINAPVKIGWDGEDLVAEVHPLLETPQLLAEASPQQIEKLDADTELPDLSSESKNPLTQVTEQFIAVTAERAGQLDWDLVELLVKRSDGIPETVGTSIKNAATSAAFE